MKRSAEIEYNIERSAGTMLARQESTLCRNVFLDMKFDAATGRDFDETDAPFKREDFIYGWIQGRGLESFAVHADYFERHEKRALAERFDAALSSLANGMETLRKQNNGRLFFAMHPDGSPRVPVNSNAANYTDLFYARGLFAAGCRLRDLPMQTEARRLVRRVNEAIAERSFLSDQITFDPKNHGGHVPGKFPLGPMMIAIGGTALFEEWETADCFISYLLEHHVNTGQWPELKMFDVVEALDSENRPWRDRGGVLCDPGHALEFIGLTGKCLLQMPHDARFARLYKMSETLLVQLFCHVFDQGWQAAGGVAKYYNLSTRQVADGDMPWWVLPETIRAGAALQRLFPTQCSGVAERTAQAVDALLDGWLRAGWNGFAPQTRDAAGRAIPVIPALPDTDPGYHTNLPLIDVLDNFPSHRDTFAQTESLFAAPRPLPQKTITFPFINSTPKEKRQNT